MLHLVNAASNDSLYMCSLSYSTMENTTVVLMTWDTRKLFTQKLPLGTALFTVMLKLVNGSLYV